jgi:hypothetical protein
MRILRFENKKPGTDDRMGRAIQLTFVTEAGTAISTSWSGDDL